VLRDSALSSSLAERGRERMRREHRASTQVPRLLDVYRSIASSQAAA